MASLKPPEKTPCRMMRRHQADETQTDCPRPVSNSVRIVVRRPTRRWCNSAFERYRRRPCRPSPKAISSRESEVLEQQKSSQKCEQK